jgi:hypothetical protein
MGIAKESDSGMSTILGEDAKQSFQMLMWEKLVRELGAGNGERGSGISSPNFFKF